MNILAIVSQVCPKNLFSIISVITIKHPLQDHWHELDKLIKQSVSAVDKRVPKLELAKCLEYLDHNELGLAAETLADILDDAGIGRPASLIEALRQMNLTR